MNDRAKLLDLADRVKRATGAVRELDADIALTQGWHVYAGDNWIGPRAEICVPAYTASLDAAMSLYVTIPEHIPSNPRLATAEALRQRANAKEPEA